MHKQIIWLIIPNWKKYKSHASEIKVKPEICIQKSGYTLANRSSSWQHFCCRCIIQTTRIHVLNQENNPSDCWRKKAALIGQWKHKLKHSRQAFLHDEWFRSDHLLDNICKSRDSGHQLKKQTYIKELLG